MNPVHTINDANGKPLLKIFRSAAAPRRDSRRIHKHTEFELSLILSGTGLYRTDGGAYDIRPGDVFTYATNEPHCITDIDDGGMELLNIQFSPSYIFPEFADADFMKIFFARSAAFSHRLDRSADCLEEIRQLIMRAERELREGAADYEYSVRFCLVQALITIRRRFGYVDERGSFSAAYKNFPRIRDAVDYIDAHLSEPLRLDALADIAGFNRTYFCTVFRSCYGMRVWDYIEIRRVEYAKKLLRDDSERTVLSVAVDCGFNNTANYNRIFRKVTGTTPSAYRAEAEKDAAPSRPDGAD